MANDRPQRKDVLLLKPEDIEIEPGFNVRTDMGDLNSLKNSIIENGIKNPLRGYSKNGKYILTNGHRRFEAVKLAVHEGYTDILIPLFPESKGSNEESRILDLVITNDGKPLTLLEESTVYSRLSNYGWTNTSIAKKVGKSLAHISNCFLLESAPSAVKTQVKKGKISASLAIDILRENKENPDKAVEKINKAVENSGDKPVKRKEIREVKPDKLQVLLEYLMENLPEAVSEIELVQHIIDYKAGKLDAQDVAAYINALE